jgi:hypothetical protein
MLGETNLVAMLALSDWANDEGRIVHHPRAPLVPAFALSELPERVANQCKKISFGQRFYFFGLK